MAKDRMVEAIDDAVSSEHFAVPPYKAEICFFGVGAGVFNANGFNCLTFKSRHGAKFTTIEIAEQIAEKWNNEQ